MRFPSLSAILRAFDDEMDCRRPWISTETYFL